LSNRATHTAALLLGGLLWPLLLHAYPDGAPPGHTGAPGENSCSDCHAGGSEVSKDAGLRLEGLPANYEPGKTYQFTLILNDPTAKVAGFQLRVAHQDERRRGEPTGELKAIDAERVQVQHQDGIPYLSHLKAATPRSEQEPVTWQLEWQAPDKPQGPLTIHATAVAGNDDASSFGDTVHTLKHPLNAPK